MKKQYPIFDKEKISFKAKALWLYGYLHPKKQDVKFDDFLEVSLDGSSAIEKGLKELETFGFLSRFTPKDDFGRFMGSKWIFHYRQIGTNDPEEIKEFENLQKESEGLEPEKPNQKIIFQNENYLILYLEHEEKGYHIAEKCVLDNEWIVFAFDSTLEGVLIKAFERIGNQCQKLLKALDKVAELNKPKHAKYEAHYEGDGVDIEAPEEEIEHDLIYSDGCFWPLSKEMQIINGYPEEKSSPPPSQNHP